MTENTSSAPGDQTLKALRLAVLALAHASDRPDQIYTDAYEAVSDEIARLTATHAPAQAQPSGNPGELPAGYVLVPVEPTAEMGWAYLDAARLHAADGAEDTMRFSWGGYRAMLAVAPKTQAPVRKHAPQAVAQPLSDAHHRLKKAVQEAYGWLWHVNNEPTAPVPMWPPERAAYEARKCLREELTTDERGEAINAIRSLMENKARAHGICSSGGEG